MDTASEPDPVVVRLREGFDRIAFVSRADLWASAGDAGLNPTQAQVLALLGGRPDGLRPTAIAAHLTVSASSITDTLTALERKALVHREPDPTDARALRIRGTPEGIRIGVEIAAAATKVTEALAALPPAAQEALLLTQVALIRQLQVTAAIPIQRMCLTCRHFRPLAHPDTATPHHCAFVDAAFGNRELRLDCGEHEEADVSEQHTNWQSLADGSSILRSHRTH